MKKDSSLVRIDLLVVVALLTLAAAGLAALLA